MLMPSKQPFFSEDIMLVGEAPPWRKRRVSDGTCLSPPRQDRNPLLNHDVFKHAPKACLPPELRRRVSGGRGKSERGDASDCHPKEVVGWARHLLCSEGVFGVAVGRVQVHLLDLAPSLSAFSVQHSGLWAGPGWCALASQPLREHASQPQ